MFTRKTKGEDSLKKRYFYKLSTGILGVGFSLVSQAIIPRGLGPKAYGDYAFLTNFFTQFVGFLDTGTSTCFYTKLSKRPKESSLVSFYLYFAGIISVLILIFVGITFVSKFYINIWLGQSIFYIYLAAWLGIMTWVVQVLNSMSDAYGLTVPSEVAKVLQKSLGVFLIIILYVFHKLNLSNFFYYNYFILFFLGMFFIWIMEHNGYSLKSGWRLGVKQAKFYLKEFYEYSHPLFTCSVLVFIVGIMERWLLQVFGGSIQQGFYGLSYQIGTVCFLFTSAMSPLLMREFSIAHEKDDLLQMKYLFKRYIPLLYSITAYFSCFVAIQAAKVVQIFGGRHFAGASLAVAIMAFYPIHQTLGQLSASVFFATGQMRLYRNIGIVMMFLSLPVVYFLLAPSRMMGLDAGAYGLAIKMVLMNFIGVNIQIYFNSKLLQFNFWKFLRNQILVVGCLLALSLSSCFGVDLLLRLGNRTIQSFIMAGFLYSVMAGITAYFLPSLFGLRKKDIDKLIEKSLGRIF